MGILLGFTSALWLGIMTSISPCPLAANVAAISFLARKITHPFLVLMSGIAYTLGRMAAYALLGSILINSILRVAQTAQFLQKYITPALGPFMALTGLVLLEIIKINLRGLSVSYERQNKLVAAGAPGAFVLGVVFALAFCPISAALFFGSLIPLALNNKAGMLLPFVYGAGTGLPVLIFAVAIALGVSSLGLWFNRITRLEYYTRRITGVIFILIGLYYTGLYIFKLF